MARFKIGDRVTVIAEIPEYVNRSGEVTGYAYGDPVVHLDGFPSSELFGESELRREKSLPTTDTKALLRAKYKAAEETLQNKARRVLMGRFPDKGEAIEIYLSHLGPDLDDLDDARRIADFRAMLAALED